MYLDELSRYLTYLLLPVKLLIKQMNFQISIRFTKNIHSYIMLKENY